MRLLRDCYRACRDALRAGGMEAPEYEALSLLEHVTGCGRTALAAHGDKPVTEEQQTLLRSLTAKRLTHYPLQYLPGEWSFMGLPLAVGEGVLIPRDDTEVCTRLCLGWLRKKPPARVYDLCAGSGAIGIALERFADADVTAVELSEEAFYFLKKNIEINHCHLSPLPDDVLTCHAACPDGSLDLIVSNPPYIKRGELPSLQKEVQFEPAMALDGGESGYDFYECIIRDWGPKLRNGGALVFELGEKQASRVAALMRVSGFHRVRTALDLGGCERAIIGERVGVGR